MIKKIIRIAVCYQARNQAEAGKSGSQLYGFHGPWLVYDKENNQNSRVLSGT